MLRFARIVCGLAGLAVWAPNAGAYSLLGPINEPYQVNTIYYNLPGDLGAPKNLGEEYRRNTPVIYYSIDANFLDYFGSNGVYAVDQAFAIMNALTNVSSYSQDLSEFPLEAQGLNYQAQALALFDLKSVTLGLIVEQLGLAEPDRYTWTLHDRAMGTPCPDAGTYLVIQRNFDPVWSTTDQPQSSSYVNGTLYTYFIQEFCTGTPYLADAVEYPVDPNSRMWTAVAAATPAWGTGLEYGGFYTGLTRDDVGGLRYLLRSSNLNIEPAGQDTLTIATNLLVNQLLFSSNLTAFVSAALTNDAAALTALYPGLIILDSRQIFTNVVATNLIAYYANPPFAPASLPAQLYFATNYTTNVATYYAHTFGNVVTNTYYTQGKVTILTTNVGFGCTWYPAGQPCTNVTVQTVTTNMITGDFFILPTNSPCGFSLISTQLVRTVIETNQSLTATNAPQVTNVNGQSFSQTTLTYWTNHILVIHPVTCESNSVALRQGIEKITFVRKDFDSLLNRFFYPITNEYWLTAVTNSRPVPQRVMRTVFTPDILITAQDLATDPADPAVGAATVARSISYTTNSYPGLAGPGTIESPQIFTFNKVGPAYLNPGLYTFFAVPPFSEATHSLIFQWGSFDGSTNAPIVYPNGTDITNLEQRVFIQITPDYLPNGRLTPTILVTNTFYSTLLQARSYTTQFTPPYQWSLAPGSGGLPPGLGLTTTNGMGWISGTPAAEGFYDFVIRVTDSQARTVDRSYFIKIEP